MTETTQIDKSKSGYHEIEPDGGAGTVKADLIADDALKMQWLKLDVSSKVFGKYYGFKKKLREKSRIDLDPMLLL